MAAAMPSQAAEGAKQRASVFCAKQLTILFFARGHTAAQVPGEIAMPFPHVAVYSTFANMYPAERFLGWAAATKPPNEDVSPQCVDYGGLGHVGTIAASVHTSLIARVTCSLPKSAVLAVDTLGRLHFRLRVVLPPTSLVAESIITPRKSTLAYTSRYCKQRPLPA